ncbi:MAG TPA: transferase hexapeptide repeat family protein [Burkholderiaceae bacterium]|nr:transferase hexapeptide repeat family protein [Burkholderiaceae bacterium]
MSGNMDSAASRQAPRLAHPGVYEFEGVVPVIDPSAYVHPSAVLIGDVIIGPRCYVAPGAVLRGDFGRIELRADANLQDNCVVHSLPDFDCVMDEFSHIGHGAVIHGCWIGRDTLIGMNAVILDRARVGDQTIVGAMALLKAGGELPSRVLATGVPVRVVRELTDAELAGKRRGTDQYVELARRSAVGLRPAEARTELEAGRPRLVWEWSGRGAG